MDNWEKIEPAFWQPTEPDSEVVGVLSKIIPDKGLYKSTHYHMIKDDGETIIVSGSTVLDDKMALIKEGDRLKIVFKGIVKATAAGKKDWKNFEIFKDKAEAGD